MIFRLHLESCFSLVKAEISQIFFYLADFEPFWRGQPHSPDLNHCIFIYFQPEGHMEPHNEVGSLGPANYQMGFEPGAS